ncbi:MAG: hypothetical protein AAGF72_04975 [Pseudomonadota bacterium]
MTSLRVQSLFRVSAGLRDKHDYRQDSAWTGAYLMRLPDRTLVPAADYSRRLAEYLKAKDVSA